MTKIENNRQVVKKEVFKLNIIDIFYLSHINWEVSRKTQKVIDKLDFLIGLKEVQSKFAFALPITNGLSRLDQINFQELSDYECDPDEIKKIDIKIIRQAAQELEEKGYLIRDTDGNLEFHQSEAV
ncbi:hypothetical protein [Commensalibacter nepenthis]|uniref:Uncharacterized protein n=1 Tax=Commensalibacter nepenthis TaxID=3043872 RepID=A0ABT6Q813_9PROT|nr:hypothetical protein [Commensalibacter sp. TBRC 10068]MDI2113051.1 hypothetical protein [Commensalibacter sp. TBRC 10068]